MNEQLDKDLDALRNAGKSTGVKIGLVLLLALVLAPRVAAWYVDALWYISLGQGAVMATLWKARIIAWLAYFVLTFAVIKGGGEFLRRVYQKYALPRVTIQTQGAPLSLDAQPIMARATWIIALVWSFLGAFGSGARWGQWMLFFNQSSTPSATDPLFQKPVSFYFFSLPIYTYLATWLLEMTVLLFLLACGWAFFAYTARLPRATWESARRTSFLWTSLTLAAVFGVLAWRAYLSRYGLLWDQGDNFSGPGHVENQVTLPSLLLLSVVFLIGALLLIANAVRLRQLRLFAVVAAAPIAVYVVTGIAANYVSNFIVKPNELELQTPFIKHNIAATQKSFNLEDATTRAFAALPSAAALEADKNASTLENVRLWDWRAIQTALQKNQALKAFYEFPDVDVDRYRINGRLRQVMIAARELDSQRIPSRNWINEKLVYTHGYGVTVNTASDISSGGRPQFLVSEMPLQVKAPELRVDRPEIYFGQATNSHVYVKTRQREFNYPQGNQEQYTSYQGEGGIELRGGLRRLVLAWALGDLTKVPFSDAITGETRVLLHRGVLERVQKLAPFLSFDRDPYIVIADGRLVWMIDGYTSSGAYPYATQYPIGGRMTNYLRNSVKATIDAYDGTANFYVFDEADPIIGAWRGAFPTLFKSADEMPKTLRDHVRYPEGLLRAQAEAWGLYHMENPQTFFNRGDAWTVASLSDAITTGAPEVPLPPGAVALGMRREVVPQTAEPHYVLMPLDGQDEYVLTTPFTPPSRETNLIGWMAGRSDGDNYGKLWVYNFPNSDSIPAPQGIRSRISQDANLSQQLALWDSRGSRVLWGNLLTIPLGRGLLFVQPIFLQAERSPIPELKIVVLATPDQLVYAPTYREALEKLLGQSAPRATSTTPSGTTPSATGGSTPARPSTPAGSERALIERAARELEDYQKLTAQGKYGEAGQKLEALGRTLRELRR